MQFSFDAWWRNPRLLAAGVCAALGVAVLVFGPQLRTPTEAAPLEPEVFEDAPFDLPLEPTLAPPTAQPDLIVYVSGAVSAPDVYRLPPNTRLKDAVLAAGGFRADADPNALNLAAPISDAQHIHVPAIGETPPPVAAADSAASSSDGKINLNLAGESELEELPGIGSTLAARIVERRTPVGPYTSVEELREVTGVGDKLFSQIETLVTVGP